MAEPDVPADCSPPIRRLLDYWLSIHPAPGVLPGRQHLDPTAIPDLLPWLWMLDVQREPLRFKYRLVGTEQAIAMEADFTGRWLDEVHPAFPTSTSYPHYVAAVERHEAGYLRGPAIFHMKKDYVSIERLLLALARNGRDVDVLLAITLYARRALIGA